MLSERQIRRMVEAGTWRRLVDRILSNGRCGGTAAKARLISSDAARPAGLGLALQRLCELTYGPSTLAATIAGRLIRLQRTDGMFSDGVEGCPAATAVATRGLLLWHQRRVETGASDHARAGEAVERGIESLAAVVRNPMTHENDLVDVEVILWQLGRTPQFRRAAGKKTLRDAMVRLAALPVEDDLARFAHAAAA